MVESLALWGVEIPREPAADSFEVALANADAFEVWLACETQWRMVLAPSGSWIWLGLEYPAVEVVLRRLKPAEPDAVFADMQLMERAALATFNEIT